VAAFFFYLYGTHTLWISPSLSSIHPLHLQRQQQWAAVIAGSV